MPEFYFAGRTAGSINNVALEKTCREFQNKVTQTIYYTATKTSRRT
jgi:hypothetical protein